MTFGELLRMNEAGAAPMGDEAAVEKMKNGGKADGEADSGSAEAAAEGTVKKKGGRKKKAEG